MSGKELFVAMISGEDDGDTPFVIGEVISKRINGNMATLLIKMGDEEEEVQMVKENGEWKLHLEME
jgi:hypothetical protein